MTARMGKVEIDAIFELACGCTTTGCSGSDPGRKFVANGPGCGVLYCTAHQEWVALINMISAAVEES